MTTSHQSPRPHRSGWVSRRPRIVAALTLALLAAACSSGSSVDVVAGDITPEATATPAGSPAPTTPTADPTVGSDAGSPTGAPSSTPEPEDGVDDGALLELDIARTRWAEVGSDHYAYTYTRFCECSEETAGPIRVVVRGGAVERTTWFGNPTTADGWTAEELFADIDTVIRSGREVDVTYDPATGLPVDVALDLEAIAVDGGFFIETRSFIDYAAVSSALAEARARWDEAGLTDYVLEYREICFCPEILVTVTVRGAEIVDSQVSGGFEPGVVHDVPGLFDRVVQAIDHGAYTITATYDPELGHPLELYIDVEEFIADEEQGVSVIGLEPLE